jgi:hypothetical protein
MPDDCMPFVQREECELKHHHGACLAAIPFPGEKSANKAGGASNAAIIADASPAAGAPVPVVVQLG